MKDLLSEVHIRMVQDILVREFGVERRQLTPEARLREDLGPDSLTLVETAMALEEAFHINIPDERWEQVQTIGDLYATVAELMASARA